MLSFNWENTTIQISALSMVFGSALSGLHVINFFLMGLVIGVSTTLGKKRKESVKQTKKSNTKNTPKV